MLRRGLAMTIRHRPELCDLQRWDSGLQPAVRELLGNDCPALPHCPQGRRPADFPANKCRGYSAGPIGGATVRKGAQLQYLYRFAIQAAVALARARRTSDQLSKYPVYDLQYGRGFSAFMALPCYQFATRAITRQRGSPRRPCRAPSAVRMAAEQGGSARWSPQELPVPICYRPPIK